MQIDSILLDIVKNEFRTWTLEFIEAILLFYSFTFYQNALSAMVKEKVVEMNAHFIWFSHVYLDLNIFVLLCTCARVCAKTPP